ncbi:hypothetical protein ACSLFT_19375 [Streptomyces sp. G6]|uniref:hypothetical protein n=1 Tax=Streptomyces sp. G6 TaxID=1178736 RepID=UPI003ED86631
MTTPPEGLLFDVAAPPRRLSGCYCSQTSTCSTTTCPTVGQQPPHRRTGPDGTRRPDAVVAAELFITERRRRGVHLVRQPPALSPTQDAALRAVA